MKIEVYTDGSATVAEKPGGYGYVVVVDGQKHAEGAGHLEKASNNDAELEAAIQGLSAAFKHIMTIVPAVQSNYPDVYLVSDSQLVLGWADGHFKFKQASKMDQFYKLKSLMTRMNAKTRWVRGHSGDEHNERCDRLANEARTGLEKKAKKEAAKVSGDTLIGNKKTGVICVWYKDCLKIVDLSENIVETYNREIHGSRGSMLEIREEKSR